jgi:Zn-dependent M28 family amino/carboxypeptidase
MRIIIKQRSAILRTSVFIILVLAVILVAGFSLLNRSSSSGEFDGERAMQDVHYQVSLGPRIPGSKAHSQTVAYIQSVLEENFWNVEVQDTSLLGKPIQNVIAKRGSGKPWIILGAHYDSRLKADRDPDPAKQEQPVPGANDGASGVAVLLELARVLPQTADGEIWLVFFDAEDNGRIDNWDWIMGSVAFVQSLQGKPDGVIVVDMIGDADQNIYLEKTSDAALKNEIWDIAHSLGYKEQFIAEEKHSIIDDHTPFLRAGIPAVDIIDFDYEYWHTTADTPDKVSAASLQSVGDTLYAFLTQRNRK